MDQIILILIIIIHIQFQQQKNNKQILRDVSSFPFTSFHVLLCSLPAVVNASDGFFHISLLDFPRSPAELSREPERLDRLQMEELGDPPPVQVEMLGELPPDVAGTTKDDRNHWGEGWWVCWIDTELSKGIYSNNILFNFKSFSLLEFAQQCYI